ncbi:MAG TPA: TonB-dependent receptor [Opitutaceae bacterium]|nr:TonB-dependent receptor [Opitutaceae bacterium]
MTPTSEIPVTLTNNIRALMRRLIATTVVLVLLQCCGIAAGSEASDSDEVIVQEPFTVQGSLDAYGDGREFEVEFEKRVPASERGWSSLMGEVPNFHVASGGAGSYGDTFGLRGLANTPYFGDPAVTVYLGDLALGSSFTYPVNLSSFTRATLAKGPQGTRVGRAGVAGVVTLESTAPGSQPTAELRLGAGDFGARTAMLDASTARGRTADASLNVWHEEHAGFLKNTLLNTRVDDRESTGGSARMRLRPGERVEFALQVLAQRSRGGAQPLVPLGGPLFEVSRNREGSMDIDSAGVAFRGSVELSCARLSAVTNYSRWNLDPYDSHFVLPPGIDSRIEQEQRTWSEEIRVESLEGAPVNWIAGLWLARTETDGNVFRELTGLFPIEGSSFEMEARTAALFGEVDFPIGANWTLTAGARAEQIDKKIHRLETVPATGSYRGENNDGTLQGKLSLSRAFSTATSAHLTLSTGVKPGGFSAFTDNSALAPFDAERLFAIESGVHVAPKGGAFSFDLAAFAWFVRDFQIERSFTATDYIVVNAPRARSIGGEANLVWRPATGWTVRASAGVSNTTLREFTDPFTDINYDGNRAPFAPEYTASLQVAYRSSTGWFGAAEVAFTGRTFFSESEESAYSQSAYSVLSARLGYEGRGWRVTAYGSNLADTGYYSLIVQGIGHGVAGAPRTFGVEIGVKF